MRFALTLLTCFSFLLLPNQPTSFARKEIITEKEVRQFNQSNTLDYYPDNVTQAKVLELQAQRLALIRDLFAFALSAEEKEAVATRSISVKPLKQLNAGVGKKEIVFYDGMLLFTKNVDELALILGHEYGHVLAGHYGKKKASNILGTTIGLLAGTALAATIGNPEAANLAGNITTNMVAQGVSGRFSQRYERTADEYAVRLIHDAGFDFEKALGVRERFVKRVPKTHLQGFFATHPSSAKRIQNSKKYFQEEFISSVESRVANHSIAWTEKRKELDALESELSQLFGSIRHDDYVDDAGIIYAQFRIISAEEELERRGLTYEQLAMGVNSIGLSKKLGLLGARDKTESVSLDDEKIYWYASFDSLIFDPISSVFKGADYKAYWFAPNGDLYEESFFGILSSGSSYVGTELNWDPALGDYLIGTWSVEVYRDDVMVDEREFEVTR